MDFVREWPQKPAGQSLIVVELRAAKASHLNLLFKTHTHFLSYRALNKHIVNIQYVQL
mgnify:CR=1 FL=1|jgi:hypothetical protein